MTIKTRVIEWESNGETYYTAEYEATYTEGFLWWSKEKKEWRRLKKPISTFDTDLVDIRYPSKEMAIKALSLHFNCENKVKTKEVYSGEGWL